MTNSNQLRFLRLDSERKKQVKLNGFVAEVASPSLAILVRPRFFLYISVKTCSKQPCSEIKGIAGKMTENTLNCWFCNVFSFQLNLCVWFYVCCNRLFFKTISILALKQTYQLRCMTIPLRMLTTISHQQWQAWTAVSPLADTTGGDMVVRMRKALAIPRSW